jgi:hypothetical protein
MNHIAKLEQELLEDQKRAFDGLCMHCLTELKDQQETEQALCKKCQKEQKEYMSI